MKTRKTLCLLLALVLVVSAAGTAFAASHTVAAGKFGTLTGTIDQDTGPFVGWSVTLTASIDHVLSNTILSMGVRFTTSEDPTYGKVGNNVASISQQYYVPFSADWEPTHAYGNYEVYAPGEKPYTTYTETTVTRPA